MDPAPIWRPTARLLVLDSLDRLLLFSAEDPRGTAWFTPGGAIHRGETLARAAVRELAEGGCGTRESRTRLAQSSRAVTVPAPTVRPPSRIAKVWPASSATGLPSATVTCTVCP